jgi:LysM repeat protein
MLLWIRLLLSLTAVFLGVTLGGCSMSGESQQDDEKEPHYVLGKSRVNAADYTGAAEAFAESLEVSPRSAAAHYQLAWLNENKLADPAAAIYHYQEYLKLNPKAGNRDVINQRVSACKQALATDVMQLPITPAAQRQLEQLSETNRVMREELDKWHAYYAAQTSGHPSPAANPEPGPAAVAGVQPVNQPSQPAAPAGTPPSARSPTPATSAPARSAPTFPPRLQTHTIAAGETLATIARKAGVSVAALEAANPGINPRRLRRGQILNLPLP